MVRNGCKIFKLSSLSGRAFQCCCPRVLILVSRRLDLQVILVLVLVSVVYSGLGLGLGLGNSGLGLEVCGLAVGLEITS